MEKTSFRRILRANYQQILLVFLAFLLMVLVSFFYVSSIVRAQMLSISEATMNTIQTAVSASLSEAELNFANITQQVETLLANGAGNDRILRALERTNRNLSEGRLALPDFMKIYGFIRGEFLDGSGWVPPDDYSPPARPWYIGADGIDGMVFFSEPYLDAETGDMCISFSRELFDAQEVSQGILAIDLRLSRITDYVSSQQIANDGYGVLLSDTLHFTTHRDPTLVGMAMADAGGDYARLAQMLEDGALINGERFTDVDGTDSIAYFRSIFTGWQVGVITSRASYYADLYIMGWVLGVLGLVLMVALSALLVRSRVQKMRSDEESRSKSSFLARMSHEIRTPMNAIIGMTEIAKSTDDPQKIQDSLEKIGSAADHLLGVINDILDMSKIEAGKLELSDTDFALRRLVEQVVTVTGVKMEEKHQSLTVHIDNDVPEALVADRQRLAQVITNLLSNANKFTPEGGNINLSFHLVNRTDTRCTLQIDVVDDGIGLSPEQQARLFQSFEQADNSISRKYGGTGLGLAISKKIINQMGGDAWIVSELGQGSTFAFTIKAGIGQASYETGGHALPHQDITGIFAGKQVLLAEDVEINREILITLLADTGVDIDSVENGREACDRFAEMQGAYDMIFMDIHMPEVDGYEATRCIRGMDLPNAGNIPIVAMTANVFREDIERCLAAGMNDHVGKPIEIDDVVAKMKQYMG